MKKRLFVVLALLLVSAVLLVGSVPLMRQVAATESEEFYMFFPIIRATLIPRKGVAGSINLTQLAEVRATWYHHWSLCKPIGTLSSLSHNGSTIELLADDSDHCVDVSKGFYFWEEYNEGPEEIEAAMIACRSGWFMIGDEWVVTNPKLMADQIEELNWYIEKRDEVNEDCKIAFGGVLTAWGTALIAPDWVEEFYDAYVEEYEEAPDVQAIVFDDYWWGGQDLEDWEEATILSTEAVYDTYGTDIEIWAREIGSLHSHQRALDAMDELGTITPYYDRYAWFIGNVSSSESQWASVALWWGGVLTDLGELYQVFEIWW